MAPVCKRNNLGGPARENRQGRRTHRALTDRRRRLVAAFMEVFRATPQNFPAYGSEGWIHSLLEYMNERPINGLNIEDIRIWLKTDNFFQEDNRVFNYGNLQAQGPADDDNPDEPRQAADDHPEADGVISEGDRLLAANLTHYADVMSNRINELRNAGQQNLEGIALALFIMKYYLNRFQEQ